MANLNIIMTEFGRLMAPTTKRTLDFATRVLRWFRKLDDGTKMLIVHILALGPILIGLGIALKVIAFALGGLATIVAVAPFAGLIAIFAAIAGAAYLAARGIRWLLDWLNQFTVGEGPHAMGVGGEDRLDDLQRDLQRGRSPEGRSAVGVRAAALPAAGVRRSRGAAVRPDGPRDGNRP